MIEMEKDPDSSKLYTWDLTDYLADRPDQPVTITAADVLDPGAGITVTAPTHDDTTITAEVSGGTVGQLYTVTARFSLSNGEDDDRSILLYIIDK